MDNSKQMEKLIAYVAKMQKKPEIQLKTGSVLAYMTNDLKLTNGEMLAVTTMLLETVKVQFEKAGFK